MRDFLGAQLRDTVRVYMVVHKGRQSRHSGVRVRLSLIDSNVPHPLWNVSVNRLSELTVWGLNVL